MSDCAQLTEHYEAYALGALEGEDRAELQAHLVRACPTCTPALDRARWLVAQLAYAAPEIAPPASLRRRVLEAAGAARPPERKPQIPVWAWAGVAALVVLSIFSFRQTRRLQTELTRLREQVKIEQARRETLESDRQRYQQALAILAAPGTREASLKSAQGLLPEFRAYWNPRLGLVLSAHQVPLPAADRTFQLWVVPKKGNPISAGVFRPDTSGQVLFISTPEAALDAAAALAISNEPAGGSPQPTTTPLWVGPVS